MDNPGLPEVRDACADLGKRDEEEDDIYDEPDEELEVDELENRLKRLNLSNDIHPRRGDLPKSWAPEQERQVTKGQQERHSIVEQSSGLMGIPEEANA